MLKIQDSKTIANAIKKKLIAAIKYRLDYLVRDIIIDTLK